MPLYRHRPCKAVAMETVPLTAHRNGSRNGNTHRKHLKLPPEHECSGMGMSGPIGCVLDAWDQMVVLFWKAVNTWRGRCSLGEVEITLCLCLWFLSTMRGRSLSVTYSCHHHVLPKHTEPRDHVS